MGDLAHRPTRSRRPSVALALLLQTLAVGLAQEEEEEEGEGGRGYDGGDVSHRCQALPVFHERRRRGNDEFRRRRRRRRRSADMRGFPAEPGQAADCEDNDATEFDRKHSTRGSDVFTGRSAGLDGAVSRLVPRPGRNRNWNRCGRTTWPHRFGVVRHGSP